VLLIDADMRKGYLDQLFEAPAEQGLAEILSGQIIPSQAVQPTQTPNLDIITHGTLPDNPSELLMSNRLRALLEWAKPRYDHIIIDTPPVLSVTDATIIGQMAGITLLVARYESTTALELDRSAAKTRTKQRAGKRRDFSTAWDRKCARCLQLLRLCKNMFKKHNLPAQAAANRIH
jgi:tyrosine-protein kinase Etk/Wzc